MDPTVTLAYLIAALATGQKDYAAEHLDNLIDWLDAGGFAPTDRREPGVLPELDFLVDALVEGDVPEATREFADLTGLIR